MTRDEIVRLVREALRQVAADPAIADLPLDTEIAALGIDSRSTMEVLANIEDTLVRSFRTEELSKFRKLQDIVDAVAQWR
jgi:acyl carrier protein